MMMDLSINQSISLTMNATNMTEISQRICSKDMPLSNGFFVNISVGEKAMICICAVITLITVFDFAEQVRYVLHRYQTNMAVKYRSIYILGIYPAVSITSLVALLIPRANLVCQLASSVYISRCMFEFVTLMVLYFGGPEKIYGRLKDFRISMKEPPCCCCCCCLPTLAVTLKNILAIKIIVLQNAILQPLITFITVVLWIDGKYTEGQFFPNNSFLYLLIITTVSSIIALYGFMVFFKMCKEHLRSADIVPKCVILQLVIVFCQLQDVLFFILEKFDLPACERTLSSHVRGQAYLQMMLVFQMFLLSLIGRCFYRRPHDIMSDLPTARDVATASPDVDKRDIVHSPEITNTLNLVMPHTLILQK